MSDVPADWIAHGIMDSIVDSFFPFLTEIEKEVDEIETLVVSDKDNAGSASSSETAASRLRLHRTHSLEQVVAHDSVEESEKMSTPTLTEKAPTRLKSMERKTRFSLPMQWPLCIRRTRRCLREGFAHFQVVFKHTSTISSTSTVLRMARTRRLVTSLTRFLAHKSEVVAQLQKRLLTIGEWGLGRGTDHDHDVFIYMGDVQGQVVAVFLISGLLTGRFRPHHHPAAVAGPL